MSVGMIYIKTRKEHPFLSALETNYLQKQRTILGWIRTSMSLRTLDFNSNEYTISPQLKLAVRSFVARERIELSPSEYESLVLAVRLSRYKFIKFFFYKFGIISTHIFDDIWSITTIYNLFNLYIISILYLFNRMIFFLFSHNAIHRSPSIIYLLSTKLSNKNPSSFSYFLI